jgi:mono/diheme cytochrome c family protein
MGIEFGARAARPALQRPLLATAVACVLAAGPVAAQKESTRGQLLYGNHCIACHDQRMHWRDQRRAHDWQSLRSWVRHWQGTQQLQWSDADIDEVARHLNDTIYRFPRVQPPRG